MCVLNCKVDDEATIGLTCIVAQTLSLLSPPIEPDAEAHEDDPTGASNSSDEGRLFHHVGDLLCNAVVPVSMDDHVPEFLTFGQTQANR